MSYAFVPIPKSTNIAVRRVMQANKGKDTKPELEVRRVIRAAGYRGYRTSWKKAPGRPDIAFAQKKVAVIIHGCFWHGCKKCTKGLPKTNSEYWSWKIANNRARDARNLRALKREGRRTLVIWEHDVKSGKTKEMLRWLSSKRLFRLSPL